MQDKKGISRLSDSEEAECAYFIENPIVLFLFLRKEDGSSRIFQ